MGLLSLYSKCSEGLLLPLGGGMLCGMRESTVLTRKTDTQRSPMNHISASDVVCGT